MEKKATSSGDEESDTGKNGEPGLVTTGNPSNA